MPLIKKSSYLLENLLSTDSIIYCSTEDTWNQVCEILGIDKEGENFKFDKADEHAAPLDSNNFIHVSSKTGNLKQVKYEYLKANHANLFYDTPFISANSSRLKQRQDLAHDIVLVTLRSISSPTGLKIAVKCENNDEFAKVTEIMQYNWIADDIDLSHSDCIGITIKSREKREWFKENKYLILPAADFILNNSGRLLARPAPGPESSEISPKFEAGRYLVKKIPAMADAINEDAADMTKCILYVEILERTKTAYNFVFAHEKSAWMLIADFDRKYSIIENLQS